MQKKCSDILPGCWPRPNGLTLVKVSKKNSDEFSISYRIHFTTRRSFKGKKIPNIVSKTWGHDSKFQKTLYGLGKDVAYMFLDDFLWRAKPLPAFWDWYQEFWMVGLTLCPFWCQIKHEPCKRSWYYTIALHATNCNADTRANIVTVYTDYHCIVQSVQYQLRSLDK